MSNPLESWNEEQRSALLYRDCADSESDSPRAELFRRLAGEAEAQAAIWRAQLTARGHPAKELCARRAGLGFGTDAVEQRRALLLVPAFERIRHGSQGRRGSRLACL